jgi:hypothetical protein
MKLGHPEFQKKYYNMLVINYLKKLTFLNAEVRKNWRRNMKNILNSKKI